MWHPSCAPGQPTQAESRCEISIVDFQATIDGPVDLVSELRGLYPRAASTPRSHAAALSTQFRIQIDAARRSYDLQRDGATLWATERREDLVPTLEWAVNTAAVELLGDSYLLFHAGSVARRGRGILLPASSGCGKSTLVAGLAAAGFECFGDDVAAVDPSTLQLAPFAKRICVKSGSRAALTGAYPGLASDLARRRWGRESVWYLEPPGGLWPTGRVPVRYVVLPRYVPGARTTLTGIARSAALLRLLEQSFSARRCGAGGVGAVVEIVRAAACYDLIVGELNRAVALLLDLVESSDLASTSAISETEQG